MTLPGNPRFINMAPKITNLYVICGLCTLGGLLQGFGVSSLSAILATWQVRCTLSIYLSFYAQYKLLTYLIYSTKTTFPIPSLSLKAASWRPWPEDVCSARSFLPGSVTALAAETR